MSITISAHSDASRSRRAASVEASILARTSELAGIETAPFSRLYFGEVCSGITRPPNRKHGTVRGRGCFFPQAADLNWLLLIVTLECWQRSIRALPVAVEDQRT